MFLSSGAGGRRERVRDEFLRLLLRGRGRDDCARAAGIGLERVPPALWSISKPSIEEGEPLESAVSSSSTMLGCISRRLRLRERARGREESEDNAGERFFLRLALGSISRSSSGYSSMSASPPECGRAGMASMKRRLGGSRDSREEVEMRLLGPRGSEAVRIVPILGSSLLRSLSRPVKEDFWSFKGSGRRCCEGWLFMDGGFDGGEVGIELNNGLIFSDSGGGVGGNMLRLTGGSDCCLDLLCRLCLMRFEAPYEIISGGRSS